MSTKNAATVTATYHHGLYQPPVGRPCWHTVRVAAVALGVSERAVQRLLRSVGGRVGQTVSGMVELGGRGFVPVRRA